MLFRSGKRVAVGRIFFSSKNPPNCYPFSSLSPSSKLLIFFLAPAPFLPFLPLPILKARTSLMFLLNQQASPSALAFSPSSSPPLSVTLQLPKDSSFLPVSLFFHKPSPALLFTHQQHGFFPQQHGLLALLLPVQSGFPPAEKGVPPSPPDRFFIFLCLLFPPP